jgi:hypothetical protein
MTRTHCILLGPCSRRVGSAPFTPKHLEHTKILVPRDNLASALITTAETLTLNKPREFEEHRHQGDSHKTQQETTEWMRTPKSCTNLAIVKNVCCFFLSLADDAYSRTGITFSPKINLNPKVT